MWYQYATYDENNNIIEVKMICNKCGKEIILGTDKCDIFERITQDYCISKDDIICECGNVQTKGIIQPKQTTNIGSINTSNYNNIVHINQTYSKTNIPKCLTCQSTNLKKITLASKAGSVFIWGIFAAGRTSKTWHCNNCGAEW